jgi:catechol 2,3-dioxygenase-like lactoylglutathione lyase family enzyme
MATAFWHVGLTVADLGRSIVFYRDVVGLDEGETMRSANAQFAALVNNPGAELKAVFMTQGAFTLQLLEYTAGGGRPLALDHNNPGSPHLSFFVADIDATYRAIAARGDVAITSAIVANARGTIRSFYAADPDGVPVEFVERTGVIQA